MNKREKVIGMIGSIVLIATVLLYFLLTSERSNSSYVFGVILLLIEMIFFGGWMVIENQVEKHSQLIMRAGCGSVLTVYALAGIITAVSFIYINRGLLLFIAIQIVLLAAAAILCVLFYAAAGRIKAHDNEVLNAVSSANQVAENLTLFSQDVKNADYREQLKKLAEDMRFSDISTLVPCDYDIASALSNLEVSLYSDEDGKNEKIQALLENIRHLIQKRKIQVKESKGGQL